MPRPFKIPESVLVVIHTPARDVLLINRADAPQLLAVGDGQQGRPETRRWRRPPCARCSRKRASTAARHGLHAGLKDWGLENIYDIYPRWQHRYAPGVTRNTEHVFGLCVPDGTAVTLNPREHTGYRWLPWRAGRRRLLLAVQRRGDPVAATI